MENLKDSINHEIARAPKVDTLALQVDAEEYGFQYQKYFQKLYETQQFCDIVVRLGQETLNCHQIILSTVSPKLNQIILDLKRTTNSNCTLMIQDDEAIAFKVLLEYVYKGSLEFSEGELLPLLKTALAYEIHPLKNACGDLLANQFPDFDSLDFLLETATKYDCSSLKKRCGRILAERFSDLWESKSFLELDLEVWKGILMSSRVKIKSEEKLFSCVLEFAKSQPTADQERIFEELLPHIHFSVMDTEYLIFQVEQNPEITKSRIVRDQLFAAYRTKVLNSSDITLTNKPLASPRKYVGETAFRWSMQRKPLPAIITNQRRTACSLDIRCQVQTENNITCGSYFEINVDEWRSTRTDIVIGIAPGDIPLVGSIAQLGIQCAGWGYSNKDGNVYQIIKNSGSEMIPVLEPYNTGDRIRVTLNDDYSITFAKNGKSVHTIPTDYTEKCKQQQGKFVAPILYPTVSIHSATVSLMQSDDNTEWGIPKEWT